MFINTSDLVLTVRNQINDVRQEFGFKPLEKLKKGYRQDCSECPISQSLKDIDSDIRITEKFIKFSNEGTANLVSETLDKQINQVNNKSVELTDKMKEFIRVFDEGNLEKFKKTD